MLPANNGCTLTVTVAVFTQPLASVPVTVYTFCPVGFAEVVCPDWLGLLKVAGVPVSDQVYDVPPVAVSVEVPPGGTVVGLAEAVIVGSGLTAIKNEAEYSVEVPSLTCTL
jgi:hypothetical protein